MGREWYLNWGTKSSSKKGRTSGGGGGGSGGRNGSNSQGLERKPTAPPAATAAAAVASTGGCMNAVLHLFDFQHFQLCLHPQDSSLLPDDPTPVKGVEAPRNSLESITGEEKDDHLLIVKKGIQIKTNRRDTALKLVQVPRTKIEDFSSESSYSPAGPRTPNLVARLMGLEILPESNTTTPRSSSHSQISPHIRSSTPPIPAKTSKITTPRSTRTTTSYHTDVPGPRSSPETPRSSTSTRRRSTDVVVDHHRLSLQINKENSIVKEMELSRPSCSAIHTKRKDGRNYDEEVTKSPSYYARQIMKQVKETVSRRVGVDITNTINSNGGKDHQQRRDEHLLSSSSSTTTTTKPKKSKKDQTHNLSLSSKSDHQLVARVFSDIVDSKTIIEQTEVTRRENESLSKKFATNSSSSSKKPHKSFYNSIRNKKEEQFVRPLTTTNKKCKKNMLSSDLLHGTVPSSLVPLKKDFSSVTPAKLLHKQGISSNVPLSKPINKSTSTSTTTTTTTRLSRYPRQRIDEKRQEEAMHAPAAEHWRGKKDTSGTSIMEFQYITRILKCTGIDRDTPISFMRWYLPSHPLDPSIFHSIEATHYLTTTDDNSCQQLNLAINRKLLFHLVDEMLADMLKPYVRLKHHRRHHHFHHDYKQDYRQINGFQLVKILCTKIRSFPSADCENLQDIDALVEKDLPRFGVESNMIAYQEDGEEIVSEIERVIMDSLVQEIFCLD